MVKYIPPEIMEKILSRLPVKSLLRFKSICKSWNALISSHPFIRTHLLHSSHRALFIQEYSFFFRKRNLFRFQDRQFDVHLPPAGNHNFWQWCSCDGILLLEDTSKYPLKRGDLFLWNPSMRKITKLFLPNFSSPMEPLYLYGCKTKPFHSFKDYWCNIYGLCYDPATVDLKVVAFYGDNNYSVYSCKNKCWSKEHGVIAHDIMYSIYARDAVCVGGALYWIICGNYFGTKLCGDLLCFESDGDKLKKVQRPGDLKERDVFCLISLRGRLCVWCCSAGESVVRIWMRMREEGEEVWRDFMRMEDIPHPYSHYYPYPLYVDVDVDVEENEITVCLQSSRGIMVYHSREKSYEEFDLPRTEKPSEFDEATHTEVTDLFSSVDSLLFFDQHPPPPELTF